ncbi:hypothetical protein PIB30_091158, partial [Stylosanthes scabra]|nr:hypothetical protein [Stylosanthes scabra]
MTGGELRRGGFQGRGRGGMLAPRGHGFKYGGPSYQRFQGTLGTYRGGASQAVGRGGKSYGARECDKDRPGTGRAPAPQGRVYSVTAEEANKT